VERQHEQQHVASVAVEPRQLEEAAVEPVGRSGESVDDDDGRPRPVPVVPVHGPRGGVPRVRSERFSRGWVDRSIGTSEGHDVRVAHLRGPHESPAGPRVDRDPPRIGKQRGPVCRSRQFGVEASGVAVFPAQTTQEGGGACAQSDQSRGRETKLNVYERHGVDERSTMAQAVTVPSRRAVGPLREAPDKAGGKSQHRANSLTRSDSASSTCRRLRIAQARSRPTVG
jgi:hypothetical protein